MWIASDRTHAIADPPTVDRWADGLSVMGNALCMFVFNEITEENVALGP